jgi:hypothetical protein
MVKLSHSMSLVKNGIYYYIHKKMETISIQWHMQLSVSTLTSNHPLFKTLCFLSTQFWKEGMKSMLVALGTSDYQLRNGLKYKKKKGEQSIRFHGQEEMKSFLFNITDEEVDQLRDSSGDIRYEKVFRYCLPRFGDNDEQTLFKFQAARMRNYMRKRVIEDSWTPKYYTGDRKITAGHVARYYGACMAKMIMGNRSIIQIFSTRDIFNAIPSIQASMTKNCLEDLTTHLHYSDDWECDCDWDLIYPDPKVEAEPGTARFRLKHG